MSIFRRLGLPYRRKAKQVLRTTGAFLCLMIFLNVFFRDDNYHRYPLDIDFRSILYSHDQISIKKINPHPFSYKINNEMMCRKNQNTFLVILVESALENEGRRHVVRKTYGKDVHANDQVVLLFLVGVNRSRLQHDQITKESETYHDIIQLDFIDSFRNLTYKTISAYNWVVQYCGDTDFVFIVDDDIYINLRKTISFLSGLPKSKPLLSGSLREYGVPTRCHFFSFWCRYSATREEYPFDILPPYLLGRYMLLSIDVVKKLQKVFPYLKYFWIEDVYIGLAANKAGIIPEDNPFLHFPEPRLWNFWNPSLNRDLSDFIAFHQFDLEQVHKQLHNPV